MWLGAASTRQKLAFRLMYPEVTLGPEDVSPHGAEGTLQEGLS